MAKHDERFEGHNHRSMPLVLRTQDLKLLIVPNRLSALPHLCTNILVAGHVVGVHVPGDGAQLEDMPRNIGDAPLAI